MRPDPAVVPVLLLVAPARTVRAFWQLNPVAVPSAIPKCIESLTDEQGQVRAAAEFLLVKWTGRSFDPDWEGYSDQRPTVCVRQLDLAHFDHLIWPPLRGHKSLFSAFCSADGAEPCAALFAAR